MRKRLFRSRKDKIVAGVAGGIAEYFEIDPVLVRLVFFILALIHGVGVIAYIVLWIAVPKEAPVLAMDMGAGQEGAPSESPMPQVEIVDPEERERASAKRHLTGGVILIVVGVFFLADNLIPEFDFSLYWPLLFILGGAWMLWRGYDKAH